MAIAVLAAGPAAVAGESEPTLAERVADVLQESFYDRDYRDVAIPDILERHLGQARAATTLAEQRAAAHRMLAEIPISHLGLLSRQAHRHMLDELWGRRSPTFGFSLVASPADGETGDYRVAGVLEGGPADRAGLLERHRVLSIDGVAPAHSPRLDWRTDDSHLDDPATHMLLGELGDSIRVEVEQPGADPRTIEVEMEDYSVLDAVAASFRVEQRSLGGSNGRIARIGYLHLPMVPLVGTVDLVRDSISERCAECDALVFDLRGRGGSAQAIEPILQVLADFARPCVALIDRGSRSAKDVLAYEIRERGLGTLVGETTAGAVIPAAFADVGHETWLMFPGVRLGHYTDLLEGHGVPPDVTVASGTLPGVDPILVRGMEVALQAVAPTEASSREAEANNE